MKTLIVVSDYIEGQPVVASVRFAGLMQYLSKAYSLVMISDRKYSAASSQYADRNYTFKTPDSQFTQTMEEGAQAATSLPRRKMERLLRHRWVLSAWRNYKYSKYPFTKMNYTLFIQLDQLLQEREVAAVFVTIPDVYGLYILEYIKARYPHIPAIIEIRDIINHEIGEGNPKLVYKRAEQRISRLADGAIAVSQGIYQYYQKQNPGLDIQLIKNGYDEQYFLECAYKTIASDVKRLRLVHVGSIYKGRNIKALIEGLVLFHRRTGIETVFRIVGLLDQHAYEDIRSIDLNGTGVQVDVMGSLAHHKALDQLKQADIAVILTHTKGSDYAIPGKTFEYIGACKPILAVTQDRELVQLVHGQYGECASHHQEDVAAGLSRLLQTEYDFANRGDYSRKTQAHQVIRFIDRRISH